MAAINKKVGSKSNMKEIVVLYLLGTFLAAVAAVIASMAFQSDGLYSKRGCSSAPQSVGQVMLTLVLTVDKPIKCNFQSKLYRCFSMVHRFRV